MTTIALADVSLHVLDQGTSDVPLVLLHGFVGSGDHWADVLHQLAAERRVIAPDHRGHHRSSHASSYSFDELASDAVALLDELGIDRFDLVGHSMGGSVALRIVLEHPQRVRSLVLVDTGARGLGPGGWLASAAAMPFLRVLGMEGFARRIVVPLARRKYPDGTEDEFEQFVAQFGGMDIRAFRTLGRELSKQVNLVPRLSEIGVPTTVVQGANTAKALATGCRELADNISGAVLHVVEGAGHQVQGDNPEGFLAAMADHFLRVERTSP